MSKQITLTVPDVVHEAMERKGRLFDLSAGEWLKQKVLASAMGADVPLCLEPAVAAERRMREKQTEEELVLLGQDG